MTQLEGDGYTRLAQLMRGNKTPLSITQATVTTEPPDLSVRVDGDNFDTPSEGLVVADELLTHTRTIDFKGGTISGNVNGFHGPGNLTSLTITDGELTVKSPLKVGDKVIVAVADDGQLIYVLAKIG